MINNIAQALLYAVSVSYYARLTERKPFIREILPQFITPYDIPGENIDQQVETFENEIERYIFNHFYYLCMLNLS